MQVSAMDWGRAEGIRSSASGLEVNSQSWPVDRQSGSNPQLGLRDLSAQWTRAQRPSANPTRLESRVLVAYSRTAFAAFP
jgi:hypothetical protein